MSYIRSWCILYTYVMKQTLANCHSIICVVVALLLLLLLMLSSLVEGPTFLRTNCHRYWHCQVLQARKTTPHKIVAQTIVHISFPDVHTHMCMQYRYLTILYSILMNIPIFIYIMLSTSTFAIHNYATLLWLFFLLLVLKTLDRELTMTRRLRWLKSRSNKFVVR